MFKCNTQHLPLFTRHLSLKRVLCFGSFSYAIHVGAFPLHPEPCKSMAMKRAHFGNSACHAAASRVLGTMNPAQLTRRVTVPFTVSPPSRALYVGTHCSSLPALGAQVRFFRIRLFLCLPSSNFCQLVCQLLGYEAGHLHMGECQAHTGVICGSVANCPSECHTLGTKALLAFTDGARRLAGNRLFACCRKYN